MNAEDVQYQVIRVWEVVARIAECRIIIVTNARVKNSYITSMVKSFALNA